MADSGAFAVPFDFDVLDDGSPERQDGSAQVVPGYIWVPPETYERHEDVE